MAELLTTNDKRTCLCAELSSANVGQTVCVMGWAQKQRDLGALIFIDLRDRSGIVQLAFDDATDREPSTRPSLSAPSSFSAPTALSVPAARVRSTRTSPRVRSRSPLPS